MNCAAVVVFLAHSKNALMQWRGVCRLSVCPSVCRLLRKSLLLAHKWPDRHQTFTRWTPGQRASRVCSRSKVTWYAHCLGFLEWATPSLTVWLLKQFDFQNAHKTELAAKYWGPLLLQEILSVHLSLAGSMLLICLLVCNKFYKVHHHVVPRIRPILNPSQVLLSILSVAIVTPIGYTGVLFFVAKAMCFKLFTHLSFWLSVFAVVTDIIFFSVFLLF